MTGMLVQSPRTAATIRAGFVPKELEPAFSTETRTIAGQIDALRIGKSPSSITEAPTAEKDLAERVFESLAAAKILTSQVAMHLERGSRDRLFQQLDSLHDTSEWEEGDEPVHSPSFATFLKAILYLRPERRPGLGLSHDGNLIAAWTTGHDRLTIEFLPNDRVRWVLARYEDDEPDRFAGQTGVTRLAEGLAPHRPEHWFSNEGRQRQESPR
jgi:hypothetical protein